MPQGVRIDLTDEQIRLALGMRARLKSWAEIADTLGISAQSAYKLARRYGLPMRPERPAPDLSRLGDLTPPEHRVWMLVDVGKKRPCYVAQELKISKETVFNYLGRARKKLGAYIPGYYGHSRM